MLNCEKCEKSKRLHILFLIISPKPIELKWCTIPHFKAIDLLFWPLAWLLTLRLITFALESKMSCKLFFSSPSIHQTDSILYSPLWYIRPRKGCWSEAVTRPRNPQGQRPSKRVAWSKSTDADLIARANSLSLWRATPGCGRRILYIQSHLIRKDQLIFLCFNLKVTVGYFQNLILWRQQCTHSFIQTFDGIAC